MRTVGLIGLALGLALSGCQRQSYTEEDVQRAIAERQEQTKTEIEQGVRAAPPVEVETPSTAGAPPRETAAPSGEVNLPPPNRYEPMTPATRELPAQQSPPPNVGDVKLDPQTGQYGIQPPGAPETYTIPLDRQQGQ
jgi:type IV secretory pathway VirB10-like protein